jgi:hypothetical protein
MQAPFMKVLTIGFAAVLALGTADAASAKHKKAHRAVHRDVTSTSIPVDRDGTPIIMQGYGAPVTDRKVEPPRQKTERAVKIPRGSSTYIPPPNPSPYANPPPPLTKPPGVYTPPPINSYSDRVTNCIHSYPLNKGIGNNPTDQQAYVRQCAQ